MKSISIQLQEDIAARLQADPYLSNVGMVQEREGWTESELKQNLGPYRAGGQAGALPGLMILVRTPGVTPMDKNALTGRNRYEIVVQPSELPKMTTAKGAKHWEDIADRIEGILHLCQVGPAPLICERRTPFNDGEGTTGCDIVFSLVRAISVDARCMQPTITPQADGSLALACNTAGATVYLTTNGSYPTPVNDHLPLGSYKPAAGTFLRAVAYKDGMTASGVSELLL